MSEAPPPGYGQLPASRRSYGSGAVAPHAPREHHAGPGQRLGPRQWHRSEPRFGVAVALAVVGVIVLGSATGSGDSGSSGDDHKAIGIVLSLALVAAGYGIVWV